MRKIAILSDIHGNIPALEAVVADIRMRQVERVYNLGDHVSGPLWPKETIQFLMKQDWLHVKGNHDRHLVEDDPAKHGLSDAYAYRYLNDTERNWLSALPASIETEDGFMLFHGIPSNDSIFLLETIDRGKVGLSSHSEIGMRLRGTGSAIILCGHSHIPRVVGISDTSLIINPGSVGLPAYEDEQPEYLAVETGSPHARYAILEYQNNGWVAEQITIPYDYQKAAEQAHNNDRPDWEIGLMTGFVKPR